MNQTSQKQFSSNRRHTRNSTNRKESLVMSPCCLVCCMLSCQFADIPVPHPAPMNPGHWHWNAPRTLAHVPPFWHGLLLLLVHSSMSEKRAQAWTFFAWFVTFCIFKKLLVSFYIHEPPDEWFHRKYGQRQILDLNLIYRVTQQTICVATVELPSELFITENTALSWEQSEMLNETTHTIIVPIT